MYCYKIANELMDYYRYGLGRTDAILHHGLIEFDDDGSFRHAWVEVGGKVIGEHPPKYNEPTTIPKARFYKKYKPKTLFTSSVSVRVQEWQGPSDVWGTGDTI